MSLARLLVASLALLVPATSFAQSATTTRLLVLLAEAQRQPTAADVNLMRVSARSGSADTARLAIRALGRLERPSLIASILPSLRHALAEVRIEAADALAQAAQGARGSASTGTANVISTTEAALIGRLNMEAEPSVRGALYEAVARLPYVAVADVERAERALLDGGLRATALPERLGLAKALETFVRLQTPLRVPSEEVLGLLRRLARPESVSSGIDPLRDARVRRLAIEGLIAANAMDEDSVTRAAQDADPQVRRLAMHAIDLSGHALGKLPDGLADSSALVRIDALRALRIRGGGALCPAAIKAATDADLNVALVAIDQLAACQASPEAIALLARIAGDTADLAVVRGWHQQVHALVALATAAPDQARPLLPLYGAVAIWQVRSYAARAAGQLKDPPTLVALSHDADDRVANVALAALSVPLRSRAPLEPGPAPAVTPTEIRRLAAARARIVIRAVGTIELALFTAEAPGTVVRFARLAEDGYYNGLSFDRFSPNAIVQGGDEGRKTAVFPFRETAAWPHVRGAVGAASPDTNDAQFFFNLVDNPRFDHQYTVFAQVLNGADVMDRLLEGDVIESITILP